MPLVFGLAVIGCEDTVGSNRGGTDWSYNGGSDGGSGGGGADALDGTTWQYTYTYTIPEAHYTQTSRIVLRFNSPYCKYSFTFTATGGTNQSGSTTYNYIVSGNTVSIIGLADGTFSGNAMYLAGTTFTKQ